ncbi:MAG: 4-alpha-glucanotransferase [Actinomycetota bacterium]
MTDHGNQLGIAAGYHDVNGHWHDTPADTLAFFAEVMGTPTDAAPLWFVDEGDSPSLANTCNLVLEDGTDIGEVNGLPAHLPIGYHRLSPVDGGPVTTVVIAPRTCPPAPRGWGVSAQVYALWRRDGWGIGDLRDVALLGQQVAAHGGSALLLSPFHAPAPTHPQQASPYYPSSRRWLNPLLIPLDGEPPAELDNAPGGTIDRDRVWSAKRQRLAERFTRESSTAEWRTWAREQGRELWQFATWNAFADRFGVRWRDWTAEYRHPDAPAVQDLPLLNRQFGESCEFHSWVQWVAAKELRHTVLAAGTQLIADLAVGCSPDGADGWLHQDVMAHGVGIGAPPDPFNPAGQNWGLPPFVPWRLRNVHYAPFIAMVRAACAGMGGLRIDHVMGLFRQYWVPEGGSPADGAYVYLPASELLAIIRLEATRAGTFVVGEDLGTVEPGVREQLRASGILGTKVWWFDQDVEGWGATNLATVTTHDLPTVAGVALGADGSAEMQHALDALRGELPPTDLAGIAERVHRLVASSPAVLCLASADDLAGMVERPNHPGTTNDEQPNWQRRLPVSADSLVIGEPGARIIAAIARER